MRVTLQGMICQELDERNWSVIDFICNPNGQLLRVAGLPVTEYRGKQVKATGTIWTDQPIPYLEIEKIEAL